jgi:hypothetical protein
VLTLFMLRSFSVASRQPSLGLSAGAKKKKKPGCNSIIAIQKQNKNVFKYNCRLPVKC